MKSWLLGTLGFVVMVVSGCSGGSSEVPGLDAAGPAADAAPPADAALGRDASLATDDATVVAADAGDDAADPADAAPAGDDATVALALDAAPLALDAAPLAPDAAPLPPDAGSVGIPPDVDGRITINELMAYDAVTLLDDTGIASDWIEVRSILALRCADAPACFQDYVNQTWDLLALTEAMNLDGEQARVRAQIAPWVSRDIRKRYSDAAVAASQQDLHYFVSGRRADLALQLPPRSP